MSVHLPETGLDVLGQIRPGSAFGDLLTRLARHSETIVETGTWRGLGSTYCFYLGLERPSQRLFTVELCEEQHREAMGYYDDPRITFLHGTLVLPEEVPPFDYPDPDYRYYYEKEIALNAQAPYVLDRIPERIDLLLIDGGFWSAQTEYAKLADRSKIIALDDTNAARESKNVRNRTKLLKAGWKVLGDQLEDRNGWAVFERP